MQIMLRCRITNCCRNVSSNTLSGTLQHVAFNVLAKLEGKELLLNSALASRMNDRAGFLHESLQRYNPVHH